MNAAVKRLDVICIGRVAVDLYAQQIGARLEDVASFSNTWVALPATSPSAPPFRD